MGFWDTLKGAITGDSGQAPAVAKPQTGAVIAGSGGGGFLSPNRAAAWGPVGATAVMTPPPQWRSADRDQLGPGEPDRTGGQAHVTGGSPMVGAQLAAPWGSENVDRHDTRPGGGFDGPWSADPAAELVSVGQRPTPEKGTAEKAAEALAQSTEAFLGRFNGQGTPDRAGEPVRPSGAGLWEQAKPWVAVAAVVVGAVMLFRASR